MKIGDTHPGDIVIYYGARLKVLYHAEYEVTACEVLDSLGVIKEPKGQKVFVSAGDQCQRS